MNCTRCGEISNILSVLLRKEKHSSEECSRMSAYFNTPPSYQHSEVSPMFDESRSRKALHKNVSKVFFCWNPRQCDKSKFNLLTYPMVLFVDML